MSEVKSNTTQRENKHAILYFSPQNSSAYKELAARIRAEGGRTTCVWSQKWKGAESLMMEGRAIVIEEGCMHAEEICDAYRKYANDVEIHFADANGQFKSGEQDEAIREPETANDADADADTAIQTEAASTEGGEDDPEADASRPDVEEVYGAGVSDGETGASDQGSAESGRLED